ncbi:CHAT domain-containing protein [Nocardiopsis valliformis]|uniref:CHAT domain-containing protein n=1 Tax=Nocardiopsis valliformis TaxID=239974 RepID=UPI000476FCEF|nr:CHAT domain-containing protein [Nocardiopsis valliformis]
MLPSATPVPESEPPLRGTENPALEAGGRALLSRVTQGVQLARRGRFEETVEILDDTRKHLRGHPVAELAPVLPGILTDLGLAQVLCGRFGQAEDHLNEARDLADARRLPLLGLVARHNLGCLDLYRGDTAEAITTFHELAHLMPADRQEPLRVDLAEAYLSVGLVEEAGRTLAEAPWRSGGDGTAVTLLEAKYRFLDGDRQGALHLAQRVLEGLGPSSLWYGVAHRLKRVALESAGSRTPVQRAKDHLELRTPAVSQPRPPSEHRGPTHPFATRHLAASETPSTVAAPEPGTESDPGDESGSAGNPGPEEAGHRNAWDSAGTQGKLSDARRALERFSWAGARTGALAPGPWLGAAARDPHVVRAGLESALQAGDPATALEWAELDRTWSDWLVPELGACDDPEVRELTGRYRDALENGGGPAASAYARRWESAQWRLPPGVARRSREHPGPVLEPLLSNLHGRAFVHYTVAGAEAVALVAVDGKVHQRCIGPLKRVRRTLRAFTHELSGPLPLRRSTEAVDVCATPPSVTGQAPTRPGAEPGGVAAALVSDTLLGPLLPLIGERPLVVTGDSYLGDLPWGLLPALRGRPVRLVPTARSWAEPPPVKSGDGRVLLACGPPPGGAQEEVAALAGVHSGAMVLEQARRGPLLAELARADLAHLAGHGRAGASTPMLSRLQLCDGLLLACDLFPLPSAPALVVLSACWGGHGFGGAGGRPSGFVGALLARGTRTVVASPVPVDDARTGAAMQGFHRAVRAGTDVSEAVSEHLGHIGFCCYGT